MSASGALLSFTLGPVQTFIASARTVRDLWTGSYLLSWLTFAAMRPILDLPNAGPGAFITPSLDGVPLLEHGAAKSPRPFSEDLLVPCLPNRFLARLPDGVDGRELGAACEKACRDAWHTIEQAVRKQWGPEADPLGLWNHQVRDVFEIAWVVLPLAEVTAARTQDLLGTPENGWPQQLDLIGGLLAAARSVRHVPVYPVTAPAVPQKCSLLGTYEQLGPATLSESRAFWTAFARRSDSRGSRIGPRERLCAIALVKRFAWAHYFSTDAVFRCSTRELRFADTATTAARPWLEAGGFPRDVLARSDWSGSWLHWTRPDQDPDAPCPPEVWAEVQKAHRSQKTAPSPYYAILMLDGDRLGANLRDAGSPEKCQQISRVLTRFARTQVRAITEAHSGELIYTGGDDVLALLPARHALACARELEAAYCAAMQGQTTQPPTLSGGLIFAHYKEDLRFALQEARDAEKTAKQSGRDALALRILRRSGEHTETLLGWQESEFVDALVTQFAAGFSDRWVYRLRSELPTLATSDAATLPRFRSEVARLLDRAEVTRGDPVTVRAQTLALFDAYAAWAEPRRHPLPFTLTGFVTLVQSAAFLARGREE